MRKIIEITALIIFIAAIHLAGCDSESWTWFYWSKFITGGLMGVAVLLGYVIKRKETYEIR
jgi:hypothetical protein